MALEARGNSIEPYFQEKKWQCRKDLEQQTNDLLDTHLWSLTVTYTEIQRDAAEIFIKLEDE